jgi:hypothetical protein
LLFPLLAVPLVWRYAGRARRVAQLGAVTAATLAVLAPWVAYNLGRFDDPVLVSTGGGGALAASSCDQVFFGARVGWWYQFCIPDAAGDESVRDGINRDAAFDYLWEHERDVPRVVAARVGRVWQVYRPFHTAELDWFEGRGKAAGLSGVGVHLAVLPLAIAGGFVLHGRRRTVLPFVAMAATVTLTAALFYGAVRFRSSADVVLVVLAAVTIDAMLTSATAARAASIGSAVMRKR